MEEQGDVDKVLSECKYTVERTYHTKANQQTMMETFRTACYMDHFGRLVVLSSTQIPFHVRRIVGRALDIPASKVRVIKPRIGGGFGAKQTSVSEIYPAIVTWKTGRPSKMIFSRYESMICSSPRHEMEITVRAGADENGIIRAIDVHTLSNTGAYGEHSSTTVGRADTNLSVFTDIRKLTDFPLMWYIPICRQQVPIVDMVPHRVFLPWNLR